MEGELFDGQTRKLQSGRPTRRTLMKPLVALAVAARIGFGTIPDLAVAKKGRKRKKCKKPKPGPTCPAACPDTCHLCATRRAGSPVCGDTITFSCTNLPCTADNDCVGKVYKGIPVPYCITGYTTSGGSVAQLGCAGACAGLTTC